MSMQESSGSPVEFLRLPIFLEASGMSSSTFYRKVDDGVFHPRKDGKTVYVDLVEVRAWYAGLTTVQEHREREKAAAKRRRPSRP